MSVFNINLEGNAAKRLTTAGKYCDRDIVVTPENLDAPLTEQAGLIEAIGEALVGATAPGGGAEDLNAELTAQESAIAVLMGILRQKAGLVPVADEAAMAKAAAFDIIMNGEG